MDHQLTAQTLLQHLQHSGSSPPAANASLNPGKFWFNIAAQDISNIFTSLAAALS